MATRSLPPFLRTPPFPHTQAARVAISRQKPASGEAIDLDRAERLLAAIAHVRVGGAFWGDGDSWRALPPPAGAPGDADIVAIAAIRGQPCRITRPGRYGTPATGPDRAAVLRHLIAETAYTDPFRNVPIAPEQAVALLAEWRGTIDANAPITLAAGIAWWKRAQVRAMLWPGRAGTPRFVHASAATCHAAAMRGGAIATWPSQVSQGFLAAASRRGIPIVSVEDGFIRSVGLGSALHPPYSLVVDALGIHYDPTRPSTLETVLETAEFEADLLARAAALRHMIVAHGIGKYGQGAAGRLPTRPRDRRLVLVTGQVSDDLSVRYGGSGVDGNLDLLARARAVEPDAEIWFRPHPDVDAGHRNGAVDDADALRHADRVVRGGSMAELLDTIDGLHVLTSLSGFEALLRGRDVTVHGLPFYAGWGLTTDLAPQVERRTRRLSLDALVAATLILYPRYLDPVTNLPCTVETLVGRLIAQASPKMTLLHRLRAVQGQLSRVRF